jgi:hypothetical protein
MKTRLKDEDRKETMINWRATARLVQKLDEGATRFGTRSEFIRHAIAAFRFAV